MPQASYILDAEAVRDIIAAMITDSSSVTAVYDDAANTLTFTATGGAPSNMVTTDTEQSGLSGTTVISGKKHHQGQLSVGGSDGTMNVWEKFRINGDWAQLSGTMYVGPFWSAASNNYANCEFSLSGGPAVIQGNAHVILEPTSAGMVKIDTGKGLLIDTTPIARSTSVAKQMFISSDDSNALVFHGAGGTFTVIGPA